MQRCSGFSRWTDPRCNADEQSFIFAPKFRAQVAQVAGRIGDSTIRMLSIWWLTLPLTHPTGIARKQKVSQSFQADLPCPVVREKRILFSREANQSYNSRHPGPQEGRWPSSRTLGRAAVDAKAPDA
ncbi:hypothetical protein [Bradyrhizobium sp. RDI18]|uniref:hypothetical protein n=1 Tax=Bradyrhizobium sp. RDI18 TaxID=3367400 RepID=UPI003713F9C9